MNFPEELKYTREHEWVKVEGTTALIGITDFAQKELGDIVFVEIQEKENTVVLQNQVFGIVEAVKTVSDLFMPVSGEIVEINPALYEKPELLNTSPYESWIIKVDISDTDSDELESLLDSESYRKLIGDI